MKRPPRLLHPETGKTETLEPQQRRRRRRRSVSQGNGLIGYNTRSSFRIPVLLFVLWMLIFLGVLFPLLEQQHREVSEIVDSVKLNKAGPEATISESLSQWRHGWSHIQNQLRKFTTPTSDTADTASKEEFVAGHLVPVPSDSSSSTYQDSHIQNGLRKNTPTTSTSDTASKEEFVAGQLVPAPSDSSRSTYQESHIQHGLQNTDSASDTVSKEKFVAGKLVPAPSDSSNTYQDMDAMCTLRRYTHLLGKFCDPVDRSSCDLEAFKAYFKNHSAKENLIGGCPLAEAVCYAKRYPDLFHSAYCNGSDTKCKYYSLRDHYEQHGIKERRGWGCDFQPIELAAPVSRRQPADTISTLPVSTKRENVLGKASLEVFQGSWEQVEFNQENVPSESICPKVAVYAHRFCNLTAREGYQPAHYMASGLPEWSTKRFKESMAKDGGRVIGFVGDSLMFQLRSELQCLAEAEDEGISKLHYYQVFMTTLPDSVQEHFEVRPHSDPILNHAFSLQWVDKVIADEVKYLVFNTGAWWNPSTFMKRGKWCNYKGWRHATHEELISIYRESMEQTLLPIFTSLVEDHGVIPIWMDTPPAGKMNLTTGENFDINRWAEYYRVFPRLNEIGRKMMVQAGGLVLPIWDVSFTRSMDHMFHDNPKDEDQLHWCTQYHRSVPAVWAQLLSQVMYGNEEIETDVNSNNSHEPKPSLRSIQVIKEKTSHAVQERVQNHVNEHSSQDIPFDIGHRKLAENPVSFVRLSRSTESPCECAGAMVMKQCRANIRCSWSNESNVCS